MNKAEKMSVKARIANPRQPKRYVPKQKPTMQTIICDTNIWYDLANGKNIDQINGVQLIATSVNIMEISSTPNLITNFGLVTGAVKSMYKYNHKVIISNPIEYLIELFYPNYESNTETERRLLERFNILMDINEDDIPLQNKIDAEKQIQEIIKSQNEFVGKFNNDLIPIRQRIKKQVGKDKHRKRDFSETWKQYFSKLVLEYSKQHCNKEYELDASNISWTQIEFFLYTWESYFKNNLEIGNWKLDKNDWGDLFNLVYVNPNFKYWTSENKWNKIFKDNERLRKYNFST